ncbi:multidrug effflux MFS transporter [Photobacterium sp. SDRW27]|uniref:multidrug effflux MFS transporter n=1 Tax=Photobacterium obscurum TaxID=2829490 RepID=UPI002243E5D0|nr:multidrug effflux MFS transporter [Photobacterium obscurum]MCW8327757.1 multidrug effflux MFS transporter [Photobacterium obscurum]
MAKKPQLWLIIVLMMFPQIVETIYSPVLPHIAHQFSVSVETATQTLSVYFTAFAIGVVFWGRMADILGRRFSMLAGLCLYGVGAALAILATSFSMIMIARILTAFGAAVGSVVTQTMLRDSYEGPELGKVFSIMGMGISVSPVLGLLSGGFLAEQSGHYGIFMALMVLAIVLVTATILRLPETRPDSVNAVPLTTLLATMLRDSQIWKNAILVALFNLMLFSYYSLAPFIFSDMGLNSEHFGYSGFALALGSLLGSIANKRLLQKKLEAQTLVNAASILALVAAIGVYLTQHSLLFLLPMMVVVVCFGIAIPNILGSALASYKASAGTAGATFGLMYYLMLGALLGIAGMIHNLGIVLIAAGVIAVATVLLVNFRRTI